MSDVIIFYHNEDSIYCFSTQHSQPNMDDWVPVSYSLSWRWESKKEIVDFYCGDLEEVPNPNPEYQA